MKLRPPPPPPLQLSRACGFTRNLATAVAKASHEFLRRGADAVDVLQPNEVRDSI